MMIRFPKKLRRRNAAEGKNNNLCSLWSAHYDSQCGLCPDALAAFYVMAELHTFLVNNTQ